MLQQSDALLRDNSMNKSSKWISDIDSGQPVSLVAREVMSQRIDRVRHYFPRAAKLHAEEIEYVHQLRVWTRRSLAAFDAFDNLLPRRRHKRLRKLLKRIRRAAGAARDLDVLSSRVESLAVQEPPGEFDTLQELIRYKRKQSQHPLLEVYDRSRSKLKQHTRNFIRRVRWRCNEPEPSFADVAKSVLRARADEFFSAATADLSDNSRLHQMRILGKNLRYSMELFVGAFEEGFRVKLYPVFTEVQDKLGIINDHATARVRFAEWDEQGCCRQCAQLALMEQYYADLKAAQFRHWWTRGRADDLRRQFEAALKIPLTPSAASRIGQIGACRGVDEVNSNGRSGQAAGDKGERGAGEQRQEQDATSPAP